MGSIQNSKWYNSANKQEFIVSQKMNQRYENLIKSVFNVIAEYEFIFNSDIANMNKTQLLLTLNSLSTSNHTIVNLKHQLLMKYIKYCKSNQLPCRAADYFELTLKQVDTYNDYTVFNQWFKDPAETVEYVKNFYQSYEKNDDYIGMATLCLLAYVGITFEEAIQLKISDVDRQKKTIKGYYIYDEFWDIINACIETDKILYKKHMNNPYIHLSEIELDEGYIIKDRFHPSDYETRFLYYLSKHKPIFQKAYNTNKNITFGDYYKSGMFYKQYLWETQHLGHDMNMSYVVYRHYLRWKQVFYS